MTKYLVAYYSWTGNTAKLANVIAQTLSADIWQIQETKPLSGPFAFAKAVVASLLKQSSPILLPTKNVADYDVVILGSPVWASNMASPMRTYIMQERQKIKQVAFFCTLGGNGGKETISQMADLSGKPPLADLIVDGAAFHRGDWAAMSTNFAKQIETRQTNALDAGETDLVVA